MSFSRKVTEARGNPLSKGFSFVEISEAMKCRELEEEERINKRWLP